MFFFITD